MINVITHVLLPVFVALTRFLAMFAFWIRLCWIMETLHSYKSSNLTILSMFAYSTLPECGQPTVNTLWMTGEIHRLP